MSTERDARLTSKDRAEQRAENRESSDRATTENRQAMDPDRLEAFRQGFAAELLPNIPNIEGYHVCWLTTTNARDPVYRRLSLGYELIKQSEVPGLPPTQIEGTYKDCIIVGEMIAAKLPLELYKLYMTEVHHTQPLAEEGKLRSVIDTIQQEAEAKKAKLVVEEGSRELGRRAPKAKFEGVDGGRR